MASTAHATRRMGTRSRRSGASEGSGWRMRACEACGWCGGGDNVRSDLPELRGCALALTQSRSCRAGVGCDSWQGHAAAPVSYTHLTLPTICSV
eukprot:3375154-Rhodomonas_salina.3